jgi:hypothetical protein
MDYVIHPGWQHQPVDRKVQTVLLADAMSMRQNDFSCASNASRMAARTPPDAPPRPPVRLHRQPIRDHPPEQPRRDLGHADARIPCRQSCKHMLTRR